MKNVNQLRIGLPPHFSGAIVLGLISKINPSVFDLLSPQFTQYLTRQQVALLLNVDLKTVYNWTKQGRLKAYRYQHRVFYKRHELIKVNCLSPSLKWILLNVLI